MELSGWEGGQDDSASGKEQENRSRPLRVQGWLRELETMYESMWSSGRQYGNRDQGQFDLEFFLLGGDF